MTMNKHVLPALVSGLVFGVLSVLISWALLVESSPFYEDALRPGWARYIWQILNIPAFVAIVVSNVEVIGVAVMFVQWCLIGFTSTWFLGRILEKQRQHS